jgi:hypothetical protein
MAPTHARKAALDCSAILPAGIAASQVVARPCPRARRTPRGASIPHAWWPPAVARPCPRPRPGPSASRSIRDTSRHGGSPFRPKWPAETPRPRHADVTIVVSTICSKQFHFNAQQIDSQLLDLHSSSSCHPALDTEIPVTHCVWCLVQVPDITDPPF